MPVRPTRFRGYGTFIPFFSVAKSCPGCPHAAVVLDLSFVGGHYYACLLPCDIPFDELYEHAVQQATWSGIEMRVHVGESAVPHTPGAPFHLQDGDVVTFQRPPQEWHPRQLVSELLADLASWCPPSGLPSTGGATGLLVQHKQERLFMPVHHHHGQSPVDAIHTMWDYEPGGCIVCAFPTPDLEFRGNRCSHVVYVLPIPSAQPRDPPNFRRRDVFTLCDFRGIGYSFRVIHSAVHLVHLPSVAAAFGYHLDGRKRLALHGMPDQGEELTVGDLSALTICAADRLGHAIEPPACPPDTVEPDDPEDEDALPASELAARLWPSAVAARGPRLRGRLSNGSTGAGPAHVRVLAPVTLLLTCIKPVNQLLPLLPQTMTGPIGLMAPRPGPRLALTAYCRFMSLRLAMTLRYFRPISCCPVIL